MQEEKEAKDQADFDQWKDMITVEQQGSKVDENSEESQTLLQEFVDYIKVWSCLYIYHEISSSTNKNVYRSKRS